MALRLKPVVKGLALAFGGLATAVVGAPALAQQAAGAQELEEVVVTGTRIRTPGVVSSSPITTIGTEEINATLPTSIEEVLSKLPSVAPAIGPATNNGANGTASVDLRGLGSNRNLVLINGRRQTPATLGGSADTNVIPLSMLERVDVVTGGASAVYGADAVSGVVNFIMRRNFQGFELTTNYGISQEGDAKRWRVDATIGAGFADGRGNVAMSIGKSNTDPLTQGERDLGKFSLSSTTGARSGSGTDVPAQFLGLPGGLGTRQINPTTGLLEAPGPGYNFGPENYYITPNEREQFTAIGSFRINDYIEPYAEMFFTRNTITQNLAGSGTFFNTYSVPIGNPFIPEPARQQLCAAFNIPAANCVVGNTTPINLSIGRRFTELGPRIGEFNNDFSQFQFGSRGAIAGNWSYDAYYSRGQSSQVRELINWGYLSKVRQALDAVSTTACRNTANNCVPLNVFGPDGSITGAMLNFINGGTIQLTDVNQTIYAASATGDLGEWKIPTSQLPISVAVGVERRDMEASLRSDAASQIQGEVLGTGAPFPNREGTVKYKEAYIETIVPLITGMPFAESLSFEGGYRHTDFTTVDSQTYGTYKYGAEWSPIKGLRFRAMQQGAVRAPSINELYAPQVSGLSNLAVDPCQGANINQAQAFTPGTLSNLCRETGVPLSQIGQLPAPSAGQINNLSGGNPLLNPEKADTTTIGFVWQPDFARGLTMSLDYYKIKIEDAISSASVTDVLTGCYNASANPGFANNTFCQLVFRNPNNGTFNGAEARGVFTALSNLGEYEVSGFDVLVNYRLPLRDLGVDPKWGQLDFSLNYNRVRDLKFQATPGSINRDCNGFYSVACGNAFGTPNFTDRFEQRTTWSFGDFTVGYNWRYYGSVEEEPLPPSFLPAFSSISSYSYVDLAASWNVHKNFRLNLAITNLFDKDAPNVGNTIAGTAQNSGNTFPQVYDVVGRYFSFGLTMKF